MFIKELMFPFTKTSFTNSYNGLIKKPALLGGWTIAAPLKFNIFPQNCACNWSNTYMNFEGDVKKTVEMLLI